MAEVRHMKKTKGDVELESMAEEICDAIGAELITKDVVDLGEGKKSVLIAFEEYFFRNSQYASLNIMLTDDGYVQTAVVVGSGGGSGLTNISWGANKSFAKRGTNVLEKLGFVEDEL